MMFAGMNPIHQNPILNPALHNAFHPIHRGGSGMASPALIIMVMCLVASVALFCFVAAGWIAWASWNDWKESRRFEWLPVILSCFFALIGSVMAAGFMRLLFTFL